MVLSSIAQTRILLGIIIGIGISLLSLGLYMAFRSPAAEVHATPSEVSPSINTTINKGRIPVDVPFTDIGIFTGHIVIQLGGRARVDHTMPDVGPEGLRGQPAADFFALPGADLYCAIGRVGGKKIYIGERIELNLTSPTRIEIGPNDEPGKNGMGFKDNTGAWDYTITKLN